MCGSLGDSLALLEPISSSSRSTLPSPLPHLSLASSLPQHHQQTGTALIQRKSTYLGKTAHKRHSPTGQGLASRLPLCRNKMMPGVQLSPAWERPPSWCSEPRVDGSSPHLLREAHRHCTAVHLPGLTHSKDLLREWNLVMGMECPT